MSKRHTRKVLPGVELSFLNSGGGVKEARVHVQQEDDLFMSSTEWGIRLGTTILGNGEVQLMQNETSRTDASC
eukprot:6391780-Amphidinium_carterae.1